MKGHAMLNVLIYLFKNHLQNKSESGAPSDELTLELEDAGFDSEEIEHAFSWLSKLDHQAHIHNELNHNPLSLRVYSDYELSRFTREAQAYLLNLEQQLILTPFLRETIINQALIFEKEVIDVDLLKWLTLMVLCNQSENSDNANALELLVLEDSCAGIH